MERLDVSGYPCPTPAIRTRLALDAVPAGGKLEVVTTDRSALSDIPSLVRALGHELISISEAGDEITFRICKS